MFDASDAELDIRTLHKYCKENGIDFDRILAVAAAKRAEQDHMINMNSKSILEWLKIGGILVAVVFAFSRVDSSASQAMEKAVSAEQKADSGLGLAREAVSQVGVMKAQFESMQRQLDDIKDEQKLQREKTDQILQMLLRNQEFKNLHGVEK